MFRNLCNPCRLARQCSAVRIKISTSSKLELLLSHLTFLKFISLPLALQKQVAVVPGASYAYVRLFPRRYFLCGPNQNTQLH